MTPDSLLTISERIAEANRLLCVDISSELKTPEASKALGTVIMHLAKITVETGKLQKDNKRLHEQMALVNKRLQEQLNKS